MPGPEFFQTVMGHAYYEYHFPELVKQFKRLNDNLETLIKQNLEATAVQPPVRTMAEPPEQCTSCGEEEGFSETSAGWVCDMCETLA